MVHISVINGEIYRLEEQIAENEQKMTEAGYAIQHMGRGLERTKAMREQAAAELQRLKGMSEAQRDQVLGYNYKIAKLETRLKALDKSIDSYENSRNGLRIQRRILAQGKVENQVLRRKIVDLRRQARTATR